VSLDAWVDELGRELTGARRIRRPPVLVMLALLAAAIAAFAAHRTADEREVPAQQPTVTEVAPDTVLRRTYMAVACPEPNDVSCDRVGIYAEVKQPARAVTAQVGGRKAALDDPEYGADEPRDARHTFAGFLQPAGLRGDGPLAVDLEPDGRWTGHSPVSARVTFVIEHVDGTLVRTTQRLALDAGFG
jgi:hypothetical protein